MSGLPFFPSALASTNPGMTGSSFAVPYQPNSYASQYFPNPPSQPNNVTRDPLMGSLMTLSTLSDTTEVLNLPDLLVFSTINDGDSSLHTTVMPVINTKNLTVFRFTVKDHPQMPIEQVGELGVPRYLHNRKWTSTTSLSRWAIGNRYSMEFLKHAQGEQQQIADKTQIALSFAGLLDMIVLHSLKTAHKQLRMKLEEFGQYSFTDLSDAMEWQRYNFAALQKREHGWSIFLQKAKKKMQAWNGSATALIVDRSIAFLFADRPELIHFWKSGQPASSRVNNPERLMSENTPVDKIMFTDFKPAVVGSRQSPMQHVVQIGSWFVSQDLPIFTSNQNYPSLYSPQCRDIQIYDQELDSFVVLKLGDLVKHSMLFDSNENLNKAIFSDDGQTTTGSDFMGRFFQSTSKDASVSETHGQLFIQSFMYKICKMGNITSTELNHRLESGLEVYRKMASQDFDRAYIANQIRWSCVTGKTLATINRKGPELKFGRKNTKVADADIDADATLVDSDTSSLIMNRSGVKKFSLPSLKAMVGEKEAEFIPFENADIYTLPPSTFCGYLSWDGFVQMHDFYESLPSTKKALSETDWVHIYNFVETIRLIVSYWRSNLSNCGLFDTVKQTNSAIQKTHEESLVDQVFNFNATFSLWTNYHKLGLFFKGGKYSNLTAKQYKGVVKGTLEAVVDVDKEYDWDLKKNANQEAFLASIYDRLISESLSELIEAISSSKHCSKNPAILAKIKKMLSYKPSGGLWRSLPELKTCTDYKDTKVEYAVVESIAEADIDIESTIKQLNGALKNNAPVLTSVHWALVGEWVLNFYEYALYSIYQVLIETPSSDAKSATAKIKGILKIVNTIFTKHDLTITDADMVGFNTQMTTLGFKPDGTNACPDDITLIDIAKIANVDADLVKNIKNLWFKPGDLTADELIAEKKKTLEDDIKDIVGAGPTWKPDTMIFKPLLPNKDEILKGNIPLLRNTRLEKLFQNTTADKFKASLLQTFESLNKTLAEKLGLTIDDNTPGHSGSSVAFFGARSKTDLGIWDDQYIEHDPKHQPMASYPQFDKDASIWVKTPFTLSIEQVKSLYAQNEALGDKPSELDFRVHYTSHDGSQYIVHPTRQESHKPMQRLLGSNVHLSYLDYSTFIKQGEYFTSGELSHQSLPFIESKHKCKIPIDGESFKISPKKHVGDDLFGYRLNLEPSDIKPLANNISIHTRFDRSPINAIICLLAFTTKFNKTNSAGLIKMGITYPVDFIIFRLWSNYTANIMFLLKPGIEHLGFVALTAADHRSGQTPMDKTGMFNSSVWAGGIVTKPENTMTIHNAAIISFGHGGGSGYFSLEEAQNVDVRANNERPDAGKSSKSLLVSAIPKGSCPNRNMISATGYLPEGDYESSGLQMSKHEASAGKHYPTCSFYANQWGLGRYGSSAKTFAESLGPDGTTLTTNVVAYKGTTRYFNPFNNSYNVMTLNTGHFGINEGPGCRESRLNGTSFPEFGYEKNPAILLVN